MLLITVEAKQRVEVILLVLLRHLRLVPHGMRLSCLLLLVLVPRLAVLRLRSILDERAVDRSLSGGHCRRYARLLVLAVTVERGGSIAICLLLWILHRAIRHGYDTGLVKPVRLDRVVCGIVR